VRSTLLTRRLALFPVTTQVVADQHGEHLTIGGCDLADLAGRFGTPLYLYDEATLDDAARTYQRALAQFYPGQSGLTYAGKAFLCLAMAEWVHDRALKLDCSSVGELAIASAARLAREMIILHGVNKSEEDLVAGLAQAGTIVVDNLSELRRLITLSHRRPAPPPELWLRIRPGIAVTTHDYTQTGQQDSKFGMEPEEIPQAVSMCDKHGLSVTGLHFHLGSHFREAAPVGLALDLALDLLDRLRTELHSRPWNLCPGGGWGVAYHEDEIPHPDISGYVRFVARRVVDGCRLRGLPLPHLHLEPGRSLIARAGVALYRVGTVKHTPGRRWLLLDGGLADNPRPALYSARYSALPVHEPNRPASEPASLAGPYCESSDILIQALPLPNMREGDLIAIPVSGAYQLSMASNYNAARRPAVLWLGESTARLIQAREETDDLLRRDRPR
jgi:diaminopimelate decarboxylase